MDIGHMFIETKTPQQMNSYDCGIYVIMMTELAIERIIAKSFSGPDLAKTFPTITEQSLITKRSQIAYIINNRTSVTAEFVQLSYLHLISYSDKCHENPSSQYVDPNDQVMKKKWKTPKKVSKKGSISSQGLDITLTNKFDILSKENIKDQTDEGKKLLSSHHSFQNIQKPHHSLVNNPQVETVKVELYADSQGKGLPEIIGACSKGKVSMDALVKSGADVLHVYSQAAKSGHRPVVLIAGTNDMLKRSPQVIYSKLENKLKGLSSSRPVCITTVPPRFDLNPDNDIHYDIALVNNYVREIVARMDNVKLIDLDLFKRYHFTHHGFHLNHKGKKKLAFLIIDFLKNNNASHTPILHGTRISPADVWFSKSMESSQSECGKIVSTSQPVER